MDSIPQTKTCLRCGETKAVDEFWNDRRRNDGRYPYCKVCGRALNNARYEAERPQRTAYSKRRWQQVKDMPEYRVAANKRTLAWAKRNPSKRTAIMAAWRAANRDRVREYQRGWMARNRDLVQAAIRKRYARKHNAAHIPFTVEQLAAKLAYWGNCCWVCGGEQQAVDHVKPLGKGGAHILANLRPICRPCNQRKHDKWPYP